MAWNTKMKRTRLLGLSVLVWGLGACGDDPKPGAMIEADSAVSEPPSSFSMDGGRHNSLDASEPQQATRDSATVLDLGDGAAAPLVPNPTPDPTSDRDSGTSGLLPALPPGVTLPTNGKSLSACYSDMDCTEDNLSCVHALGLLGAGYCYNKCETSADCQTLAGVSSTCSIENQCVFDCTGTGLGNGTCPPNMICRDIVPGLPVPIFRCEYPYGSGGKLTPEYGQCDQAHGSNDCKGDSFCYVPISGIVTPPSGPGYCAPGCSAASDCSVPAGATATASCSRLGSCEMDCTDMGTTCPAGMQCVDVDNAPLISAMRCRYAAM
ncbi:MAG: hypothetical protein JWN04_2777 [Myxococcaceae bacterium]|nr:hypothetical protein [Myxococcaceae bacterium]